MSISSTYSSSTSNRITGLATGLDTDTVVKNMTARTRSQIALAKQQATLLEWKRDAYRSVIDQVTNFKNKYFSLTSSSSILLSSRFQQMGATIRGNGGNYVNITVGAGAQAGQVVLSNAKKATASTLTTQGFASQHAQITADFSQGDLNLAGKEIKLNVAGVEKTITLTGSYSNVEELAQDLQNKLNSAYSADRVVVSVKDGSIYFHAATDTITIDGENSSAFTLPQLTLDNAQTQLINTYDKLENVVFANSLSGDTFKFKINDQEFTFSKNNTIADIISTINASSAGVKVSYSSLTDSFTFTSSATGSASGFTFEDTEGNLLGVLTNNAAVSDVVAGDDAEIYINGVKIVRSTNLFTVDGMTIEIKESYAQDITVDISQNVDGVLNAIKDFINDYNKLIEELNSQLSEKYDRNYPPLTDEQKEEMSEKQIEQWEAKAKTGLLSNDPTIRTMLQNIRTALLEEVVSLSDGSSLGISLNSIGISTGVYTEQGKLNINEDKLRNALLNNPELVTKLFTQKSSLTYSTEMSAEEKKQYYKESGLMQRLSSILESNVKNTREYGSLLRIAGYKGTASVADNQLQKRIDNYNKTIDTLKKKLANEEDRYYKQFAALEASISYLQQQSLWLSSMMGY